MSTFTIRSKDLKYSYKGKFNCDKRINTKHNAMEVFYADPFVPTAAKLLNYLIIFFASGKKVCYTTNSDLADKFKCHPNSVDNAYRQLDEEFNFFERKTYFSHKDDRKRRRVFPNQDNIQTFLTTFEITEDMNLHSKKLLKYRMIHIVNHKTRRAYQEFKNTVQKQLTRKVFNTYNISKEDMLKKISALRELDESSPKDILFTRQKALLNRIEAAILEEKTVKYADRYLLTKWYNNIIEQDDHQVQRENEQYLSSNKTYKSETKSITKRYTKYNKRQNITDINPPEWMDDFEKENGFI